MHNDVMYMMLFFKYIARLERGAWQYPTTCKLQALADDGHVDHCHVGCAMLAVLLQATHRVSYSSGVYSV